MGCSHELIVWVEVVVGLRVGRRDGGGGGGGCGGLRWANGGIVVVVVVVGGVVVITMGVVVFAGSSSSDDCGDWAGLRVAQDMIGLVLELVPSAYRSFE